MQEYKYRYWVVTLQFGKSSINGSTSDYLPTVETVLSVFDELAQAYVFQIEVTPLTKKDHFQCVLTTKIRKRHSTLLKELANGLGYSGLSGVQVDRMRGTWEEAVAYCSKADSRKEGTYPFFSKGMVEPYKGSDITFLADRNRRYSWQNQLIDLLFKKEPHVLADPDGRTVIWITDLSGGTGKSKLVKYLSFNNSDISKISFGSAGQLRSAIINAGPKKLYFIDMPRTLGTDDSVNNILSAIEDTLNGFVVSNYYGQSSVMMFDPPHVVIFSNMICPREKMSGDRWLIYHIVDKRLLHMK